MAEVIKITALTKDFGNDKGLFNLDINVKKGEVHGLLGSNGSGKTTTMNHLMGFLKPDQGSIKINGLDAWKDASELKKQIGYIPGDIDFPDVGTGASFLKLQAEFIGMKDLAYMNYLIDLFKLNVKSDLKRMSKGMKQKTAIICAFMNKPDIIIMDEPSTGLDPLMRDVLIDLILEHKKRGKTIFMSSHIFIELEATCDTITFINDGIFVGEVNASMYDAKQDKLFKVGFTNETDYLKKSSFELVSKNDHHYSMLIKVKENSINSLFKELGAKDIKFISQIPYTLEYYYNNIINQTKEL